MNHNEARLLIGAEPHAAPAPELAEHLAICAECTQFQREMITLDSNIRRALEHGPVAAPPATVASVTRISSARVTRQAKPPRAWSGWAWAASAALASVLVIWALRPGDSLARELVSHVEYESDSWSSDKPVPNTTVSEILAKAGVTLDMSSEKVMYARNCRFRGHVVPHLVVTTSRGPVTVLVLPHEKVSQRTSFHEDGMSGVIAPAPRGSIAILALGSESVDAVAREIQQAVHWLPQP
ncbi:MAG TPA: DUF3379 family protein [Steroidobacteraceae bacterium]